VIGPASRSPSLPRPRHPGDVVAEVVQYLYKEGKVVFNREAARDAHPGGRHAHLQEARGENDGQGRIHRAVCTGDVKLVKGSRTVTCETATYEEATTRVTCTGNPVLKDGESVMRGRGPGLRPGRRPGHPDGRQGNHRSAAGLELAPRKRKEPVP